MKQIRITAIILFFALLLAPILVFNWEEGAVSAIDNRKLTGNPLAALNKPGSPPAEPDNSAAENTDTQNAVEDRASITYAVSEDRPSNQGDGSDAESDSASPTEETTVDLTDALENYVNDRIGFRDKMILAFTILNDRLFGKMVHPSYFYGKDGYVFGAGISLNISYSSFHEAFADMVLKMQNYCEARGVPFLFVFEPAKPAVLSKYIPVGYNYDRSWVDSFLAALDERGVHYVDNTAVLIERTEAGEVVFNQKYDANHWNSLGAYYGTRAVLEELQKRLPAVHVTAMDELDISEKIQTSLLVSQFPIHEAVPQISIKNLEYTSKTSLYNKELSLNPNFPEFQYYINEARKSENAPRALVFQGSYMNEYGYPYFINAFGEYIYVHDYQNVMEMQYYFPIFKPDCVIFEVAEYTFSEEYFDLNKMLAMELNPTQSECAADHAAITTLDAEKVLITQGEALTTILWPCDTSEVDHAWLHLDADYDMYRTGEGFAVTISTEDYLKFKK